jgi:hypothetical protein
MGEPGVGRQPFAVHCSVCGHGWVACYLPMRILKAAEVLAAVHCPVCGEGPDKVLAGERKRAGVSTRAPQG